jgi:hypothetical protein
MRRRAVAADVGPAPDFAAHQTPLAEDRVGAADRPDGHAHVEGEIALRRELCARRQHAAADVALDPVGEPHIERTRLLRQVGNPICHGNNLVHCIGLRVNVTRALQLRLRVRR